MEVNSVKPLAKVSIGNRTFLTMFEAQYTHNDRQGGYFFVSRGDKYIPLKEKKPDAVVIVAYCTDENKERKLVLTSEYRIPIGGREISFPAGLIEQADFDATETSREAAINAAKREFKEETGLELEVVSVSPGNLYSSGGMTNESVCIVMGKATGTPSKAGLEVSEDIDVLLWDKDDLTKAIISPQPDWYFSKVAWPFIWAFHRTGITF